MIERPTYLDRLKRLRGPHLVKVLTGMRRTGKSGILRLLRHALLEEGAGPDCIVSVNLELVESEPLRSADALLAHIRAHAAADGVTYVLLDEAQEVEDVGRLAYALHEEGRYDLYLTGSHARLVERELGARMAGRYAEIPVYPLSFAEYRAAHAGTAESDVRLFRRYLANGGLPHVPALEDDTYALRDYLDGVYHTVVRRDVAASLGREDPALLDAIARLLMDGLGQHASANGISRALSSCGRSCSDDTVALYLDALAGAYAFHRVRRYDLRSGLLLKSKEKIYANDLGLATLMLGARGPALTGLLENVVYLELRRRHREVYLGKHYARQMSFVTRDADGLAYYQVVPSALDPSALERALAPLRAERDNYPKTLLTLDEVGVASHAGIRQRNLVDWLLG